MACYAMACRQEQPCALQSQCEHIWHLCSPPLVPLNVTYRCPDCLATWTWRLGEHGGHWFRDPTRTPIGA